MNPRQLLPLPVAVAVLAALLAGSSAAPGAAAGPTARATAVGPTARATAVAYVAASDPVPDPGADPAATLGRRVLDALATSGATTLGAAVDVDGLGAVLRRSDTTALPPASTEKLFTTGAALAGLPADTTLPTTVLAVGAPVAGRQPGSLWLVGGGDPFLSGTDLQLLARSVRRAHITLVSGGLALDDSRYDGRRRAPGWKPEFVPAESGPLDALAVDRNTWRHDAAFLADPGLANLARFKGYLASYGVQVAGSLRRLAQPRVAHVLAVHRSATLGVVVRRVNRDSDNFAAELLLKELGRVRGSAGSTAAGVQAVRDVLNPLGVRVGTAVDGSGLSAYDRQTPADELALLTALEGTAAGTALRASQPVACQDGTLVHRMCGTAGAGRVAAKTGTLDGVRALTGWTTTASGRGVRFAFLLTGYRDGLTARNALDRAAVVLASATE